MHTFGQHIANIFETCVLVVDNKRTDNRRWFSFLFSDNSGLFPPHCYFYFFSFFFFIPSPQKHLFVSFYHSDAVHQNIFMQTANYSAFIILPTSIVMVRNTYDTMKLFYDFFWYNERMVIKMCSKWTSGFDGLRQHCASSRQWNSREQWKMWNDVKNWMNALK